MFQKILSLSLLCALVCSQSPITISDQVLYISPLPSAQNLQPASRYPNTESNIKNSLQGIWEPLTLNSQTLDSSQPLIITKDIIKWKNYQYSYVLSGNTIKIKLKQEQMKPSGFLRFSAFPQQQQADALSSAHFYDILSGVLTFRNMQGRVVMTMSNSVKK